MPLLLCAAVAIGSYALAGDIDVAPRDVLLEVSSDTESPYVQALFQYRLRVLARVPLRDATLSEPVAEGALLRRLGDDGRFETERDGKRYRVIERRYAVIPQRVGALTIAGPTLSAAVPVRALGEGAADALMERRVVVSRTAADLSLRVLPPPADAERPWLPAQSVSISEQWRPAKGPVRVGDPIERQIVIEATGVGTRSIALPDATAQPGLRVYPRPAETSLREVGEDLLLTTTLHQTLVPTVPGVLRLPSVRVPWWSLGMDEPRQARLPARDFVVVGAAAAAAPEALGHGKAWREQFRLRAADDAWGAPWLVLGLALAWMVTLVLWLRERRRRRAAPADVATAGPPVSAAEWVTRFQRGCERNDVKAARDALAGWARAQEQPDWPPGILAALRRRGAGVAELALVREMDRRVYAPAASTDGPWNGSATLAALAPILETATKRPHPTSDAGLPPLFPPNGGTGG